MNTAYNMPAELRAEEGGIYRYRDSRAATDGEKVSNFAISFLAKVNVDLDSGGPGFLVRIKRLPDKTER